MPYQIDPHRRHLHRNVDHPPPWGGHPPRPPNRPHPRPWTRPRRWWTQQEYRLGRWLSLRLPRLNHLEAQTAALQLLVLALTAVVLFQAVCLVLTAPR
jgi:hypothetical protein